MPLVDRLQRNPSGLRLDAFEAESPQLVGLARSLISTGRVEGLRAGTLSDTVAAVWPEPLGTTNHVD